MVSHLVKSFYIAFLQYGLYQHILFLVVFGCLTHPVSLSHTLRLVQV